jgi:hypothetical protein
MRGDALALAIIIEIRSQRAPGESENAADCIQSDFGLLRTDAASTSLREPANFTR